MTYPEPTLVNVDSKITILEGPDAVGKSTLCRTITDLIETSGSNVKVLRFPDNRGDVNIRKTLFESDMNTYRLGSMFLFLADFVHAFEQYVQPHLDDPKVKFIFDRFIPSVGVYQGLSPMYINSIFAPSKFDHFFEHMMQARYIYLMPGDIEQHQKRLASKAGEDLNSYDPVTVDEIVSQIEQYKQFIRKHTEYKLLGSDKIQVITV